MASFEAAIRDGVDGIESDVHVSKDGVVIMFHDPTLGRTTNFTGVIKESNWYGPDGMQHARTKKEPRQSIPTFAETIALLMKPENLHVRLDVDVKGTNDPEQLFTLMHAIISNTPEWETKLAPRILLGIWHPRFFKAAKEILPYCRRSSISFSLWIAREFLWEDVEYVSVWFKALATSEGQRFRNEAAKANKKLLVFTVNEPEHLIQVVQWGVDGVISDVPKRCLDLRSSLDKNYDATVLRHSKWLLYTVYQWPLIWLIQRLSEYFVRSNGPLVRPGV
ncbi:PLC-like phosphodiesterase [Roridomyces roridus]|uniref:PLC-like phosphodiesterase n=1 Tax=Roridomyces roridus TaxID=1738132 RepID=A0AAD7BWQ0_9AGAR|nr:PLC-like phosphodiesterase [Roridomyces roridus]